VSAVHRSLMISNKRGLHARAAAKFVNAASYYEAEIKVFYGGAEVCGTSIMGLMMLAAGKGSTILVSAKGKDAEVAIEAIANLVSNRFDED
jgi:phosphocarrier protein HPr